MKESYEKKYSQEIDVLYPRMVKLVKVYKNCYAWKQN